jgi:hypothetical protein
VGAIGGSDVEWAAGEEPMLAFGRERRLHARAYQLWTSLLKGRRLPAFADLDSNELTAFADHGVLIELADRGRGPAIAFLGRALRDQAGIAPALPDPAEVPEGSLLAVLLDRLPAILAAGVPIGFEAERADGSAAALLPRGILLPFAGADDSLAAVLGVMSWKRAATHADADIVAAVESAFAMRPAPPPVRPWGDGPGGAASDQPVAEPLPLNRQLAAARTWAALAGSDRTRGAAPLHAALSAAYDFLLAGRDASEAFATLVRNAGVPGRNPPLAAAELIFSDADETTRRLHAVVLAHAERLGIGPGLLADTLDRWEGGLAAFAAAARNRRKRRLPAEPDGIAIEAIDGESPLVRGHRPVRATPAIRRSAA